MKISFSLLLFFILISESIFTQTFEKIIRTDQDDFSYEAIELGNKYLYFYSKGNYLNGDTKGYAVIIDSLGNNYDIFHLNDYEDYFEESVLKAFIRNDSTLLCIRKLRNIFTNDLQLNLLELKYNVSPMELVFDTIYGSNELSEYISDFEFTTDNKIIGAGRHLPEQQNAIVSIIDLNDMSYNVWYYDVPEAILASTIMDIPEKNAYHVFMYWDNNKSFLEINKTTMEIDSIHYYPERFLPRNAVKGISDTSYFAVGKGKTYDLYSPFYPAYIEVGLEGQIYSEHLYEVNFDTNSYYTTNSFDHKFGNIYFGATYNFTQEPPFPYYPEPRWIFINKLNADGTVIWQRFYKGEVNYMPYKVLATNDGGALIFSTKYDWNDTIPLQLDLHILKIDSTGWYEGLPVAIDEFSQMKQILVYPNPLVDEVNFVLGLYENFDLQIFNINGQIVYQVKLEYSKRINLTHLKQGIYIYVLKGKNGFVEKGKLIKK
jgi:hypothetical protein